MSPTETRSWRTLLEGQPHLQGTIGSREAAADRIRTFQPLIVPGLLQSRDYAERVFGMFQVPYTAAVLAEALAARIQRQDVLTKGGTFDFLIHEAALRWCPGPRELLAAQLDRIVEIGSTIDAVSIAVIPADGAAVVAVPHGFVIYNAGGVAEVSVETVHASVEVTEPADVFLYTVQWAELDRPALHGDDALDFIAARARDLR